MEEIEVKFLDITVSKIEDTLRNLGAVRQFDRIYKRKVYDYPDLRLNAESAWIRVRDEGDQVTLGFKQRKNTQAHDGSSNDSGMDEVEVIVSDFAKTALFLEKIGLKIKFYEEQHRIRWTLGETVFDIDQWPGLNPYLEIESTSWENIDLAIAQLDLDPADKKIFSTNQVYALAGINELDYSEITFDHMTKKEG